MTATPVSVVIPTRNRIALLRRAVRSALAQSVGPREVIVVDDASDEDPSEALAALADDRVRVVRHIGNRGPAASRNTGIEAADGDVVAFLDDDDEWNPDKLACQLPLLRAGVDAAVCGYVNRSGKRAKAYLDKTVDARVLRRGNRFPPSGLVVRRAALERLRFDESLPGSIGEDWDLLIRLVSRGRVANTPAALFVYDDGQAGARVTTAQARLPVDEIDRRMEVLRKNRGFFGEFWFQYHVARYLLAFIAQRPDKVKQLGHAIRRCGWAPVTAVMWDKIASR